MRLTLLEIVQSVMNAMDSEAVSSISDLEESEQIALEARNVYFELMESQDWPHLMLLTQLEPLSSSARPNYMMIPDNLTEVMEIRYNVATASDTKDKWESISYLDPDSFLNYVQQRDSTASNIQTVSSFENVPLYIRNDQGPQYWTSFDDMYIIFDSFDNEVDSTLQKSKSSVRGKKEATWSVTDGHLPDMPDKLYPAYLAELKRKCFAYFKNQQSPEDIRSSFRSLSAQRNKASRHNGTKRVKYGRK